MVKVDEREKKRDDRQEDLDFNTEIDFDGSEEIIRLPEDYADPDREPLETAYGMPFPLVRAQKLDFHTDQHNGHFGDHFQLL